MYTTTAGKVFEYYSDYLAYKNNIKYADFFSKCNCLDSKKKKITLSSQIMLTHYVAFSSIELLEQFNEICTIYGVEIIENYDLTKPLKFYFDMDTCKYVQYDIKIKNIQNLIKALFNQVEKLKIEQETL